MGSVRVIQAILGYFVPFALLVVFLFFLEITAELMAGLVAMMFNWVAQNLFQMPLFLEPKPDFPGPLNLLNFAIGAFPSIWDIGTTLFWGGLEEVSFILHVIMTFVSGFFTWGAFIVMKNSLRDISDYAGAKSKLRSRIDTYSQVTDVNLKDG